MNEDFDPVLELEDGYFPTLKVSFIKTSTDHLFITIHGDPDTQRDSVILTENDVIRIREFLAHWDAEVIDVG